MSIPKDRRVYADQAYILHPIIQTGYILIRGGSGTVAAIMTAQPILNNQAKSSTQKRKGYDLKSLIIHLIVLFIKGYGGGGENRTLTFAMQTRRAPIITTPPCVYLLAEEVGFEPTVRFHIRRFSKPLP